MGTRNLTIVKLKGKTKVAQYGQWDGYPTGQGQKIVDFLKKADMKKFAEKVNELGVYTQGDILQAYKDAGAKGSEEFVPIELSDKVMEKHPALNRDYGAGILELIDNGTVKKVALEENFKNDETFCEFWYEIDLDKETVAMNGGKPFTFKKWVEKGLMEKLEK